MIERATENSNGVADRAAYEAAYRDLSEAAARYAAVILGPQQRSVLPDVLQDAWARAWAAWPPTEIERRDAWLLRIVRNRCLDEHRRGRRWAARMVEVADMAAMPAIDDPVSDALADDAMRMLGQLSPPLREALWLRAVEDRSYAEIAALQDVPIGTVMSRLHAARARLARQLRQ